MKGFEGIRLTVDYIKWLTSLATLVVGGGGISLGGKVTGAYIWIYVAAVLSLLFSVLAGGFAFLQASVLVTELESGEPDHEDYMERIGNGLLTQLLTFLLGLALFVAVLIGVALSGKL